jgi:hypothetical protein
MMNLQSAATAALVMLLVLMDGCASMRLAAPETEWPQARVTFNHYPRLTKVTWQPVPDADSYSVEVDCFHCCDLGKWCTDVGRATITASRIAATSYAFSWVGANWGRWRVWAVSSGGDEGLKSKWHEFIYLQ